MGSYGTPNPGSKNGSKNALRDYSRVLEFNPVTLEIVWKLTPKELGNAIPTDASKFYSPYVSSAQRLPNGNTLVTEGSDGRIIEVTKDHEIVWEWISPYYTHNETGPKNNMIYRAYRYPYDYVPQEPKPTEVAIERIDNTTYRVPGAGAFGAKKVIDVEGTLPYYADVALCVATDDEEDMSKREKVFTVDTDVFKPVNSISDWNEKVLKATDKPVLVLFGAERCVHCKALHPVLEEALKEEFDDAFHICYVNVDENKDIVEACHVQGIPVVAVYKGGKEVQRFNGERDYDDVCDFLDQTLA
ncbi:thioredoxin family protein [Absiella sp. AM54-8XD]|uniref:thioredoxin family protein n=1 Tax=Absiella sp. AM54-8XD TaxID=2292279 RepID=UPI001F40C7BE|nr:thioredoxin family protein [Absiella sp. AM54-8XD]